MPSERLASALIIEVPEAEAAVQHYRQRLDASAPLGIGAHITVLAPFMPADMIDAAILTQLEQLFAGMARFRVRLVRTGWFGNQVLWLDPQDPAPFCALTQLVYRAFPAFPPFEGRHDDVVPHLTVGHGHPVSELRTAEDAIGAHLPIEASVAAVTLVTEQSPGGHWAKTALFGLSSRDL